MAKGVLFIVCGPSGVGKTSLCDGLLESRSRLCLSISFTTRARRGDEVDGEDYHFVDVPQFLRMRDEGKFAEWAQVHGNYYGTARSVIESNWRNNRDLLFDIDYQGAAQLKEVYPEATTVLIAPPDFKTLEERLRGRNTDTEDVIQRRLEAARHELGQYDLFDYIVENRDFSKALNSLECIYDAALSSRSLHEDWLRELLKK